MGNAALAKCGACSSCSTCRADGHGPPSPTIAARAAHGFRAKTWDPSCHDPRLPWRARAEDGQRVPSSRPILESCVQPCPSAYVLKASAAEGFAGSAQSLGALELLHAAAEGCLVSALRVLEGTSRREWRWTCDQAGDTALHLAARGGHLHMVSLLLQHRAKLDTRNLEGTAALHDACRGGFAEVVQLLCDAEADPRLGELRGHEAPGFWAVRRHAEQVAGQPSSRMQHRERMFVCIEACLEAMQRWDPDALPAASIVNSAGYTGLHIAAEASDLGVLRLLLTFRSKVDAQDIHEGVTPLMQAVRAGTSLKAVQLLLRASANPGLRDLQGAVALHYAAASGEAGLPAMDLLLQARADLDVQDARGVSTLALVGLQGAPRALRQLLAAGAKPQGCRELLPIMAVDTADPNKRLCRRILEAVL